MSLFDEVRKHNEEQLGTLLGGIALENTPERLEMLYHSYQATYDFRWGELVQWKPGLKNAGYPDYGTPMVVIETDLEATHAHSSSPHHGQWQVRADLKVMFIVNGGVGFYGIDSRHVEPYRPLLEDSHGT
jgi:hypothetical protein